MQYTRDQLEQIKSKHQSMVDQCNAYLLILPKENHEALAIIDNLKSQITSLFHELERFYNPTNNLNNENVKLLTKRELQILVHISEGQPNKEIAYKLSISSKTVQFHIKNLFEKLGASSRTEVVTNAVKRKIINL